MITIVTDSSAYFKKKEAEELGLKIVPLNYSVNNQNYYENYSDCNGNFEALLKSDNYLKTSHPSPTAFLSVFEEALCNGNQVICITISSKLSGTYSSACMAAKQLQSDNIVVIDSHLTAGGLYLMVKKAKKLADKGLSLNEIYNMLIKQRQKITIAFSVNDMEPLRKSGRIGFVRMSVGTILNLKPILLCKDGVVVSDTIARGNIELVKKLFSKVSNATTEVVINYIENAATATNLYDTIKSQYPNLLVTIHKMGPTLGIHLGVGAISISCAE